MFLRKAVPVNVFSLPNALAILSAIDSGDPIAGKTDTRWTSATMTSQLPGKELDLEDRTPARLRTIMTVVAGLRVRAKAATGPAVKAISLFGVPQ